MKLNAPEIRNPNPTGTAPRRRTTLEKTIAVSESQQRALREAALRSPEDTFQMEGTSIAGLSPKKVALRQARYGPNQVRHDKPAPALLQFLRTFTNPFIIVLIFLFAIMLVTDVILADPAEGPEYTGVSVIAAMVLISAVLRFWQEYRSSRAAEELKKMVRTTVQVTRRESDRSVSREIPLEEIVPGDIVTLAAGDIVPGDVRFVRTKNLQVNQSMLTGEALPVEKTVAALEQIRASEVLSASNLGFMGTSVVSGSGTAVVLRTGSQTYFGGMSSSLLGTRPETAFDKGIKSVSLTLIRFMLVMVPVVFLINGLTKDWTTAFLFGVTTAVGLTPEMLPLIVTANLAKGAGLMARNKVIVKRLNSIQNLGAMDVLCTDKTGTLTEDRIVLERHLDVTGRGSETTLGLGAANAHFQTGLRNLLDAAVIEAAGPDEIARIEAEYTLVDEIPFDFERRRMSVVVDDGFSHFLITKGAVEELLECCETELIGRDSVRLSASRLEEIRALVDAQNEQGLRVLAVATRSFSPGDGPRREYETADESELTLIGFLAFLDPAKASAAEAIAVLREHGTAVKVITGDNELVARTVCRAVGLDPRDTVLGTELEGLSPERLRERVETATLFAKINPVQKAQIVEALRENGHTVGFLGDGINDAPALRAADVGISVDTAVDIAKESADIILLEKDLMVLEKGVIEGRRTFINTMKYIKMTASSNFGNMFSVLVASALLPFIPMIPLVVLVQNLSYDLSMLTLPWDRVDPEDLRKPRTWDAGSLSRFMIRIGPISSIFDISTFALMWFVFSANSPDQAALFQSGWFIESIISQTLIVHMIRTRRVPFLKSIASLPVLLATGAVCIFGLVLPFTGWGQGLGLVALPLSYFPWLVATLAAYCVLTQFCKNLYIRKYGSWI